MKQGTISVLVGCHSIIHSLLVIVSWKKIYGNWPLLWQIVCILIHDVGHIGLDYLDDYKQKKRHWVLGAKLAYSFYGIKGFRFVAGHTSVNSHIRSKLYYADKYSWYIAPCWWILLNCVFEPKLAVNSITFREAVDDFKSRVISSIESNQFNSSHQMFLDRSNNN